MPDAMLDIETLGTDPGAAICAIGVVRFSVASGVTDEWRQDVSLTDCQRHGLHIDAETLSWWLNQPATARDQLHGGEGLEPSLRRLAAFVDDCDTIWACSPAFDCVILREAFDAVDVACPWDYYQERDYRTIREEFPGAWPDREQSGTAHDALDDARYQAECLVDCLQEARP